MDLSQLGKPVATAGAAVVNTAVVQPAQPVIPVTPTAAIPTAAAPVEQPAPAAALGNALGGGGRLAQIKAALQSAKVGSRRNDIPLGDGLYLLKSGVYTVTERKNCRLTNYTFICLKGIKDGLGVPFGGQGYTGAIPGEEYSTPLFMDGDYAFSSILKAIAACFGWSKEMVKTMQSDDRIDQLIQFIDAFTCVSSETSQATGQACCFSNQIVLNMSAQAKVVDVKIDGVQQFVEGGAKSTKEYTNEFWNKRVSLNTACEGLTEDFILKCFGDKEAVDAALKTEVELDAFA